MLSKITWIEHSSIRCFHWVQKTFRWKMTKKKDCRIELIDCQQMKDSRRSFVNKVFGDFPLMTLSKDRSFDDIDQTENVFHCPFDQHSHPSRQWSFVLLYLWSNDHSESPPRISNNISNCCSSSFSFYSSYSFDITSPERQRRLFSMLLRFICEEDR